MPDREALAERERKAAECRRRAERLRERLRAIPLRRYRKRADAIEGIRDWLARAAAFERGDSL
jgi:hypothetical protein